MSETSRYEIDLSKLVGKLNDLQSKADGDIARVIELLLLENHLLSIGQSSGFERGRKWDFSQVPRFLKMEEDADAPSG
ncbi:hypothetical protein [Nitratireductor sp. XY-223]|uniref:hypothetical protein n=1 Tax=Nitratireductor sp. XY-223 TaxID=2561926 RepID=UPI0010A9B359|nr:hypothetical protein [Nitratireductor sp. XY-223]